jgi:hypothetical protein
MKLKGARNPKIDFQVVKSILAVEQFCETNFAFG